MIVIEADALLTIGVALVSVVVSALLSWWFTRRHYTRVRSWALTAEDVELAKARFAMITKAIPYVGIIIFITAASIGLILRQVLGDCECP